MPNNLFHCPGRLTVAQGSRRNLGRILECFRCIRTEDEASYSSGSNEVSEHRILIKTYSKTNCLLCRTNCSYGALKAHSDGVRKTQLDR